MRFKYRQQQSFTQATVTRFVLYKACNCSLGETIEIVDDTSRSIWKMMLGPFATASRRIAIHQVSLLSHAATVARRLRIDVHNNNDNA